MSSKGRSITQSPWLQFVLLTLSLKTTYLRSLSGFPPSTQQSPFLSWLLLFPKVSMCTIHLIYTFVLFSQHKCCFIASRLVSTLMHRVLNSQVNPCTPHPVDVYPGLFTIKQVEGSFFMFPYPCMCLFIYEIVTFPTCLPDNSISGPNTMPDASHISNNCWLNIWLYSSELKALTSINL